MLSQGKVKLIRKPLRNAEEYAPHYNKGDRGGETACVQIGVHRGVPMWHILILINGNVAYLCRLFSTMSHVEL